MQSEQINELAAALVAAQAEFSAVPKGTVNPFFKSKYAALPDVVNHAAPVLAKHGLSVTQAISFVALDALVLDTLTTTLLHKSGQFMQSQMLLHLPKQDPQGQGSAVTYARRYAYMSVLGLVTDDDDDGNAASRKNAPKPQAKAAPELTEGQKEVRAALIKLHPQADDRKFFLEAQTGRTLAGLHELTEAEVSHLINALQQKEGL